MMELLDVVFDTVILSRKRLFPRLLYDSKAILTFFLPAHSLRSNVKQSAPQLLSVRSFLPTDREISSVRHCPGEQAPVPQAMNFVMIRLMTIPVPTGSTMAFMPMLL